MPPQALLLLLLLTVVSSELSWRSPTHRKRVPVCVNGVVEDAKCRCDQDFVGKHCEKKKHCATFRRYRNGSCTACEQGYSGAFCEMINCVHGSLNSLGTGCDCEKPWNGDFCDQLDTSKVYGYYNRKVYWLGPLGVLSMIPMCATYIICERMARKRQVKRVQNMLGGAIQEAVLKKLMIQHI